MNEASRGLSLVGKRPRFAPAIGIRGESGKRSSGRPRALSRSGREDGGAACPGETTGRACTDGCLAAVVARSAGRRGDARRWHAGCWWLGGLVRRPTRIGRERGVSRTLRDTSPTPGSTRHACGATAHADDDPRGGADSNTDRLSGVARQPAGYRAARRDRAGTGASRGGSAALTDAVIRSALDPVGQRAGRWSIPREMPGSGWDRIETAAAADEASGSRGPALLVASVEHNFAVHVDRCGAGDVAERVRMADPLGVP